MQEQTRRHGYLLRLIGVRQVVVVVNKMDLVDYSQAVFDKVSSEYRAFLASIGVEAQFFIPVSARHGDNIAVARREPERGSTVPPCSKPSTSIPDAAEITNQPLRFPIQDVYRFDHRRILAGRIEAGTLRTGDQLLFLPSGRTSVVRSIESWNSPHVESLSAGDPAGVTLSDQLFVERGSVAVHADDAPSLATEFTARIFWLGRTPLAAGKRYKLKLVTQEVECEIKTLEEVVDASTVQTIPGADSVRTNDAAKVDHPHAAPGGRRFVRAGADARPARARRWIRRRRWRHRRRGARAVCGRQRRGGGGGQRRRLAGRTRRTPSAARAPRRGRLADRRAGQRQDDAREIARAALFERHIQVFVLDGENIRPGLSADLGVSGSDREEHMRRVAEVAKLFAEAGSVCIVSFTSPMRHERERARTIVEASDGPNIPFLEAYLTGTNDASSQYEPPEHPEVTPRRTDGP